MKPLSEKQVERVFSKHKRQMIKRLGIEPTTDEQLTRVGRELFNTKYIGTFPQDYKPKASPKRQYFIINTHTSGQPGEHWVAIVKNGKTYYIYDSFARSASKLLPVFIGKLSKYIESDKGDQEQHGGAICGQLCLAWLTVVHTLGVRNALKV